MSNAVALAHDVSDIERMARAFAASKLFGVTNPEQAVALCLIAQAEGRHPASAAQDYHIISGKPSKKADAMLRDFLSGGGKVQWHKLDDTIADATFSHPAGGTVRITWDMDRAKQAQLTTPMWKKYPRQMLRSRTVSEGVRTVYPMATSGMYVPEEVAEFDAPRQPVAEVVTIDGEFVSPEAPDQPAIAQDKPRSKAQARAIDGEMRAEIDACMTLSDLALLWSSKAFQTEFKKHPADWQEMLIEHKDAKKAELQASEDAPFPGDFVPPSFDPEP